MYWTGIIGLFVWCIAYTAIWIIKDCRKPSAIGLSMAVGAWITFLFYTCLQIIIWLLYHIKWISQ